MAQHRIDPAPARRVLFARITVAVVVLAAVAVWQWNPALTWFHDREASQRTRAFAALTAATPSHEQDAQVAAAREYNAWLAEGGAGQIGHAIHELGPVDETTPEYRRYASLLAPGGATTLASVTVPSIEAHLPVVHGTAPAALEVNAGHLYGTSLPVGGPSTHAVIAAHSGWSKATLFNRLAQVQVGDVFTISVMGRQLAYEVTEVSPVRASDPTDRIRIEEGKDLVTLTTCFPTFVNTHRLLVRAERTTDPEPGAGPDLRTAHPGFPWWAATSGGGAAGVMTLALWPSRRPGPRTHGRHL